MRDEGQTHYQHKCERQEGSKAVTSSYLDMYVSRVGVLKYFKNVLSGLVYILQKGDGLANRRGVITLLESLTPFALFLTRYVVLKVRDIFML